MDCKFCGEPVAGQFCTNCGHFVADDIEKRIRAITVAISRGKPEGKAKLRQLLSKMPADYQAAFKNRIREDVTYLRQRREQTAKPSPAPPVVERKPPAAREPQAPTPARLPKPKPDAAGPATLALTVVTIDQALTPPDDRGVIELSIYPFKQAARMNANNRRDVKDRYGRVLRFNAAPLDIAAAFGSEEIAKLQEQTNTSKTVQRGLSVIQWGLIVTVGALIFVPLVNEVEPNFNIVGFVTSLIVLVIIFKSVLNRLVMRVPTLVGDLRNRLDTAETLIRALCYDTKRITGYFDLSASNKEETLNDTRTTARGKPVSIYKHNWLSFKTKLLDGNVLRLSVEEKVKERMTHFKRGRISGKTKLKQGRSASTYKLSLRLEVDTQRYTIREKNVARGPLTVLDETKKPVEIHTTFLLNGYEPGNLTAAIAYMRGYLQRR